MQQLKVRNKDEQQIKRECKGRRLAISRNVYRLLNTDVYYVESESSDNVYYYVKYNPDVIEFCSCMDSSTRNVRCKHSFAVEFAIRIGTLKDTDKLPAEAKRLTNTKNNEDEGPTRSESQPLIDTIIEGKSYTEDDYSF